MKLEQQALVVLVFALAAILASCSGIPYNDVVVPAFKKVHPSAQVSQIYPVGGYGAESRTGGKTDIVIHFREVGSPLEEVWTVTREGGDWDVRFKCKSAGNVCLEEKGQTGAVK